MRQKLAGVEAALTIGIVRVDSVKDLNSKVYRNWVLLVIYTCISIT